MARLFIGIELDEPSRIACAALATRLQSRGFPASYVPQRNYHLTLVFLGNVESAKLPAIETMLAEIAPRYGAFEISIERVGAFPQERRPRVVFAGSRGVDERYRALASEVRAACERLGFPSDDDAIPHVTLARVPERNRTALPMLDVEPFAIPVRALTLFASLPHEGRTRYEAQRVWSLAKSI